MEFPSPILLLLTTSILAAYISVSDAELNPAGMMCLRRMISCKRGGKYPVEVCCKMYQACAVKKGNPKPICGGAKKPKRGSWNKRGGWNKRTQLEEEAGVVAPSLPQAVAASVPWVNDVTEEVGHDDAMLDDDVDFLQMMRRFY